jgi:hypothetical protein
MADAFGAVFAFTVGGRMLRATARVVRGTTARD